MTRNGRPPSMADVAELVGVSHQTVSRVVNGKGRVSPRTRERVQAAIDQLGYRPNSVARALVTARSGIIGVVTTTSAHFGPSSMLVALEVAAREAGLFTSVVALDRFGADDVASASDHFSSLAAEAIVVIAPVDSLAEAVASQGTSVPVVAVSGGRAFGRGVSVVHADQRGGARALAEHLMWLGHRDIACVAGPQEWFEARERVAGWREAMDEAGLSKREPLVGSWEARWGVRRRAEPRRGRPSGRRHVRERRGRGGSPACLLRGRGERSGRRVGHGFRRCADGRLRGAGADDGAPGFRGPWALCA